MSGSNGRGEGGCCGRVVFPTSRDVVEGWVFPTSIIIITICFPAPWRKCNATGAEDDDDDVDVGGVDGDDGDVVYYYYCDYYLQASKGHMSRE